MRKFAAVLSNHNEECERSSKICTKIAPMLRDSLVIRTTLDSLFNRNFVINHGGHRVVYDKEPNRLGFMGNIDYVHPNLRAVAIKKITGFLKMPVHHKQEIYKVLACIYGYDALNLPNNIATLLLTYETTNIDRNVGIKVATKLGINIYNLACVKDVSKVVTLLR